MASCKDIRRIDGYDKSGITFLYFFTLTYLNVLNVAVHSGVDKIANAGIHIEVGGFTAIRCLQYFYGRPVVGHHLG